MGNDAGESANSLLCGRGARGCGGQEHSGAPRRDVRQESDVRHVCFHTIPPGSELAT